MCMTIYIYLEGDFTKNVIFKSYYLLHTCVQLYLRTVPTWEQNLGVFQLLLLEGLCDCCIFFSKPSNQNVTDDLMPNSPVFHQQTKAALKENLAVYHSTTIPDKTT